MNEMKRKYSSLSVAFIVRVNHKKQLIFNNQDLDYFNFGFIGLPSYISYITNDETDLKRSQDKTTLTKVETTNCGLHKYSQSMIRL